MTSISLRLYSLLHNILLKKRTCEGFFFGGGGEVRSLYVEDTLGTGDATDAQLGSAVTFL